VRQFLVSYNYDQATIAKFEEQWGKSEYWVGDQFENFLGLGLAHAKSPQELDEILI
jgi:hypothetical protein